MAASIRRHAAVDDEFRAGHPGRLVRGQIDAAHGDIDRLAQPAERRFVQIPKTAEVLFQLRDGGAIAGIVKNDQGEPIPGARLSFVTGTSYSGGSGPALATTDKDGAYRVPRHALPLAPFVALGVHLLEVPGMSHALRGHPPVETLYR